MQTTEEAQSRVVSLTVSFRHLCTFLFECKKVHAMDYSNSGSDSDSGVAYETEGEEDEMVPKPIQKRNSDGKKKLLTAAFFLLANPPGRVRTTTIPKQPCRTSKLTGQEWVTELINGHHTRIFENCRMPVHTFLSLCQVVSEGGYISTDYRKRVSVEEAMAMVLVCASHDNRQRELAERFQRSTETIHRNLTEGIMALVRLAPVVIKARNQHLIHPKILNNTKYYPWFKDCIGAIDGTLVPAYAPTTQHDAFRCRKGYLAQNVICACDHDMRFVYVYAGMEGSAHDAACFQQAVLAPNSDFPVPPVGKYYAVDAAYRNIPGFLGPIKGKRYQISDFRGRRNGPKGKEGLFNMRHSSI